MGIKESMHCVPEWPHCKSFGYVEGSRHDSGMLAMSGLLGQLEQHSFSKDWQPLCIDGDPNRVHLQFPIIRRGPLAEHEQAFNTSMSWVRVAVEWVFGDIANYFKFIYFKKTLNWDECCWENLHSSSYALLRNALTCLSDSTTSAFCNVNPPNIDEYFR